MKKKSFIVGIVLTVIAAALCIFGSILVLDTIDAIKVNDKSGLGAIFTIPLAMITYALQAVLNLIAIGLFIGCFKSELRGVKISAIVLVAVNAAMILLSVALIVALTNASPSDSAKIVSAIARL